MWSLSRYVGNRTQGSVSACGLRPITARPSRRSSPHRSISPSAGAAMRAPGSDAREKRPPRGGRFSTQSNSYSEPGSKLATSGSGPSCARLFTVHNPARLRELSPEEEQGLALQKSYSSARLGGSPIGAKSGLKKTLNRNGSATQQERRDCQGSRWPDYPWFPPAPSSRGLPRMRPGNS
jgi:hypothetical protein